MRLDEAKQILTDNGYLVEDTSIYSSLYDFYRYLKAKAPKNLEIEGDENSITVKFKNNVAKVTLEMFDEDEDAMLYVETDGDERAFYNEHTDYGPALQFIIKNISQTNESVKESTSTKNVIDAEYDKLEGIIKKEFKRGHMSDQEYDFLKNRLDLLLDIIYKFTENK